MKNTLLGVIVVFIILEKTPKMRHLEDLHSSLSLSLSPEAEHTLIHGHTLPQTCLPVACCV